MAVYAAGREQSQNMDRFVAVYGMIHRICKGGIIKEGAGLYRAADPGKLLIDHTT